MAKIRNNDSGNLFDSMQNQSIADSALRNRKQRRTYRNVCTVLGLVLSIVMFYTLMKPAITMETNPGQDVPQLICQKKEHVHTDACWGYDHEEAEPVYAVSRELNCQFVPHVHTESCYDEEGGLICGISEQYFHVHDENCYNQGNLVCTLEEHIREESNAEVPVLVCGQEEHEGHTHSQDCYTTTWFTDEDPLCGLEEGGPHEHTEECLGLVLNCEKDHEHTDDCFTVGLICGLEAGEGHVHTLECYPSIRELNCDLEETEGHMHTEACYAMQMMPKEYHVHGEGCYSEGVLTCGKVEIKEHQHTAECWHDTKVLVNGGHVHNEECIKVLVCGLEEHVHGPECYIGSPEAVEALMQGESSSPDIDTGSEEEGDSDELVPEGELMAAEGDKQSILNQDTAEYAGNTENVGNDAYIEEKTLGEEQKDALTLVVENGELEEELEDIPDFDSEAFDLVEEDMEWSLESALTEDQRTKPEGQNGIKENEPASLNAAAVTGEQVEASDNGAVLTVGTGSEKEEQEVVAQNESETVTDSEEEPNIAEDVKDGPENQEDSVPDEQKQFAPLNYVNNIVKTEDGQFSVQLHTDEAVRVQDILALAGMEAEQVSITSDIEFLEIGKDYFGCRFAFDDGLVVLTAGETEITVLCTFVPEQAAAAGTDNEGQQSTDEEATSETSDEETDKSEDGQSEAGSDKADAVSDGSENGNKEELNDAAEDPADSENSDAENQTAEEPGDQEIEVLLNGEAAEQVRAELDTEDAQTLKAMVQDYLQAEQGITLDETTEETDEVTEAQIWRVLHVSSEESFEGRAEITVPVNEAFAGVIPEHSDLAFVNYRMFRVDAENVEVIPADDFMVDADAETVKSFTLGTDEDGTYIFVCTVSYAYREYQAEIELDLSDFMMVPEELSEDSGISVFTENAPENLPAQGTMMRRQTMSRQRQKMSSDPAAESAGIAIDMQKLMDQLEEQGIDTESEFAGIRMSMNADEGADMDFSGMSEESSDGNVSFDGQSLKILDNGTVVLKGKNITVTIRIVGFHKAGETSTYEFAFGENKSLYMSEIFTAVGMPESFVPARFSYTLSDDSLASLTLEENDCLVTANDFFDEVTLNIERGWYKAVILLRNINPAEEEKTEIWSEDGTISVILKDAVDLPEGTKPAVVPSESVDIQEYLAADFGEDADVQVKWFDISLGDVHDVSAIVTLPGVIELPENPENRVLHVEARVYHVREDGIHTLNAAVNGSDITFETDGFSQFGIAWVVTFENKETGDTYTLTLPAAEDIPLAEILEGIGLAGNSADEAETEMESSQDFVKRIRKVESTDNETVRVTETEGSWIVRIVKEGDALLAVTMDDETVIVIDVDAHGITEKSSDDENVVISTVNDLYLPEDTTVKADVLDDTAAETAIEAVKAENADSENAEETGKTVYTVFDIALENVDIGAYDGFKVNVKLPELIVGKDFRLYHIHDGKTEEIEIENLALAHEENGQEAVAEFSFETKNFSEFVLSYTVDFEYSVDGKMYRFSLPGGGFVSFSDLVEVLGIIGDTNSEEDRDENGTVIAENAEENTANGEAEENNTNSDTNTALTRGNVEVSEATRKFVSDVASVEFSSPELVNISKVENETTVGQIKESRGLECEYSAELTEEQIAVINAQTVEAGDWALISVQPFTSEECLTVTMKNGEVFTIHVTDAQIKKTVIDAKGDTWEITVTYGEDAQIPDGAELEVREIESGTGTFEQLLRDSTAELDNTDGIITFARFFDIQILNDQEKVEPATPVAVTIRYVDPINMNENSKLSVIHFSEQMAGIIPEVIKDINIHQYRGAISYNQDSFSVTGTVVQAPVASHNYAMVIHHTDGNYYVVENDGTLTHIQETDIEFNGDGTVKSVKMINPICWTYQDIGYGNYNIWHDTDAWDYHGSGLAARYIRRYLCAHDDDGYRDIRDVDVNVWDGINIQYDQNNHLLHQGMQTLTVGQDANGVLKVHGNGNYDNAATVYFAETQQVSYVSVQNHTVSHIDISVESKAGIKVPLAYGSYRLATVDADGNITGYRDEPLVVSRQNDVTLEVERMVPITQDDLKKADITAYTEWKGYREYLDDVYTVTGYSGNGETSNDTPQVRLEGSFKVADMEPAPSWCDNEDKANNWEYFENGVNTHRAIRDVRLDRPIHYSVAITKPVTFTMTYTDPATGTEYVVLQQDGTPFQKTVDVTLSSSFTYWDEDNTCPGIDQGTYGRSRWRDGEIRSNDDIYYEGTRLDAGPGMDFRLGAPLDDTRHDIVAVEIVKYVQGDYGNEVRTLNLSNATECSFDVYQNHTSASLHSKIMEVGKDGMGMLYDYDVIAGTYDNPATAQISEDPDSVADVLYDSEGNRWVYQHSRVETEYVFRNNGQNNPSTTVIDNYTKENSTPYYSDSEYIGEYTVDGGQPYEYKGEQYDGVHEYNRFLEFYVYNIYELDSTSLTVNKQWQKADGSPDSNKTGDITFTLIQTANTYTNDDGGNVTVTGEIENSETVYTGSYTLKIGNGEEEEKTNTPSVSFSSDQTVSISKLPKFGMYNGEEVLYRYSVRENPVEGYTGIETQDGNGNWTITNRPASPTDETTDLTVTKIWKDSSGNTILPNDTDSIQFSIKARKVRTDYLPVTILLYNANNSNPAATKTVYVRRGTQFKYVTGVETAIFDHYATISENGLPGVRKNTRSVRGINGSFQVTGDSSIAVQIGDGLLSRVGQWHDNPWSIPSNPSNYIWYFEYSGTEDYKETSEAVVSAYADTVEGDSVSEKTYLYTMTNNACTPSADAIGEVTVSNFVASFAELPLFQKIGDEYYAYYYTIDEIKVNDQNIVNRETDEYTVNINGTTITNQEKPGALRITKAVSVNGVPVSSIGPITEADGTYTFRIFKADGSTVATDKNGNTIADQTIEIRNGAVYKINGNEPIATQPYILINDLVPGDYVIEELESQNGVVLKSISGGKGDGTATDRKVTVTVTAGDITASRNAAAVTFINDKLVDMEIVIRKVDANSAEPLTGAKFRLDQYKDAEYRELMNSWEEKEVSTETGKEGTLKFEDLGIGFFKLVETETPAGYIKTGNDPTFSISVNASTGKLEVNFTDTDLVSYKAETLINEEIVHLFTVKNNPGAALPSTGGPGTRLFTILGSILILGAGVLLWRRLRTI